MASPPTRLRDFQVGDTVKLKGALIETTEPLFIGHIQEDGYYLLWRSKKGFEQGKPWAHMAAGSHAVSA